LTIDQPASSDSHAGCLIRFVSISQSRQPGTKELGVMGIGMMELLCVVGGLLIIAVVVLIIIVATTTRKK
jgi:hypothetical protein